MTAIIPGRHEGVENCPPPQENEKEEPKQERKGAPQPPCFRVTLRIQGEWPIPKDSTATLGSAGLLQGDAIMIQPGSAPALLEDGQKIETTPRDGGLMAQLKDLTRTLHDLVDNTIEPALANIRDQIQTIKDLLGTGGDNAENRDRLAGVFQNLEQLSADMESAVNPAQIQSILSSVQQVSANLELVSATFTERSGDIKRTVRSYGDLATDISSLVKETKPSVQRSLDDTQFLLQEISASLVPILTNIEDATRNLSVFSRDLRSNPAVIIKGREVEEETPWFK